AAFDSTLYRLFLDNEKIVVKTFVAERQKDAVLRECLAAGKCRRSKCEPPYQNVAPVEFMIDTHIHLPKCIYIVSLHMKQACQADSKKFRLNGASQTEESSSYVNFRRKSGLSGAQTGSSHISPF